MSRETAVRTPGEWRVDPDSFAAVVSGDHAVWVCACNSDEEGQEAVDAANAAFIVTACNAHGELVAALRALVNACGNARVFHMDLPERNRLIDADAAARAALAKAGQS